mmetsp:Transcript_50284/g.116078  ORF Transcript_50284/g.116078 Transcript_50284/m.116078 type:complete len:197 (-) Transcript_50284:178-768(-)
MMLRYCCALLLSAPTSAASRVADLPLPVWAVSRRSALVGATVALQGTSAACAADKVVAKKEEIRGTAAQLRSFLSNKDAVVQALVDGDTSVTLPKSVPFTTFQAVERVAGPEFMEIAIDYAEAARNARDLLRLAKLTQESVTVSSKSEGQKRTFETKSMAEAGSMAPTKEYAERMLQELLGASVALDAAVQAMDGP